MSNDLHFSLEVLAPHGLAGIEPVLPTCSLPLMAWKSGFNGKVILRLSDVATDEIEFAMDSSTDDTLYASGYVCWTAEKAFSEFLSLSRALESAGFPHVIGIDSGNTLLTISYECNLLSGKLWLNA